MYGIYVLVIIVHTGFYQVETLPLYRFPDPEWSHQECEEQRADMEKFTNRNKYIIACVQMGDA